MRDPSSSARCWSVLHRPGHADDPFPPNWTRRNFSPRQVFVATSSSSDSSPRRPALALAAMARARMLPTYEIDTLTMTVTDAVDLGAEGKLAHGYAALLSGRKRGEELNA